MTADLHLILIDHEAMALSFGAAGGSVSGQGGVGGGWGADANTNTAKPVPDTPPAAPTTTGASPFPPTLSTLPSAAAMAVHLEAANIYLHLLRQLPAVPHDYRLGVEVWASKRGPHERGGGDCPKVPGLDPAAPWLAPNCTVFAYTGLENDIQRLAEVQVWSWVRRLDQGAPV